MPRRQTIDGLDRLQESLVNDTVTIVAGTDRDELSHVGMGLLVRNADIVDGAILLTTTMDAETSIDECASVGDSRKPDIAVIDTTSTGQSIPSVYSAIPTVFTPSPGDIERTSMALSDLGSRLEGDRRPVHLLVDSLSDIVDGVGVESSLSVLRQASVPSDDISGFTVATLAYNEHSKATVDDVTEFADSVVWVETTDEGRKLSYQRGGRKRSFE